MRIDGIGRIAGALVVTLPACAAGLSTPTSGGGGTTSGRGGSTTSASTTGTASATTTSGSGGDGGTSSSSSSGGDGGGSTTGTSSSSSSGATCTMPETPCGGQCVDLQNDPSSCGSCGHDCLGGACQGAVCQPVVLVSGQGSGMGGARVLAADRNNLYWTDSGGDDAVKQVSVAGGTPIVLASAQDQPYGIAVDATSVYWVNYGGTVMKVAIGGGTPTLVATGPVGAEDIAVDATSVYWTVAETNGSVMKVAIGGGTPATIASNQDVPTSLAVDMAKAYWTTEANTVAAVPLGGGTPATLAMAASVGQAIAVGATGVYWESIVPATAGGTLMKTAQGGGASTSFVVLQGQNQGPISLAVDGANLYWTEMFTGLVNAAPFAGGAPVTLAAGQDSPYGVVVSDTAVFWVNITDGTIMKVAK